MSMGDSPPVFVSRCPRSEGSSVSSLDTLAVTSLVSGAITKRSTPDQSGQSTDDEEPDRADEPCEGRPAG